MSRIAAINYPRGYDIDRLLIEVACSLSRQGLRIGGLVQISTGQSGGNCATTTHVRDLRTGEAFDIWEDRGPCARSCRLDESGLALAEPVLQRALRERVDLLIINRFGRAESQGRGLRRYFDEALVAKVPVLTAVREPYSAHWRDFQGGLATDLDCSHNRIVEWVNSAENWDNDARAENRAALQSLDR